MANVNKKRVFVGTRDRSFPQRKSDLQPLKASASASNRITLDQALSAFIDAKEAEGVRASTKREYYRHIEYLADYMTQRECFSEAFVDDLSASLIRGYIRYLLTEKERYEGANGRRDKFVGLSPTTVNIRLRTLKTMCRFWHGEGIIDDNPMQNIKPVRTDEVSEVEGLTDEKLDVLLGSFDDTQFAQWRDKTLILLMLDTGLRPTEAAELTIDRVDFRLLTLYVPSQVAKNRRNREVPMSRPVAQLLEELYNESVRYFGETEFFFNNAYGEPFNADAFRKRLNRRKESIGLERLSPNQFRHTFARNYLLNGGDLFTLQKILDHADIKTTRKYVQMDAEHVRSQHEKFSPSRKYFKRRR